METIERHLDVAILGGGFAGVYCARLLGKKRRPGQIVGVVSEENHMVFQPMLPEVAGGSLAPRHVVNPIRLLCKGARVYKGTASAIDLGARRLEIDAGSFTPPIHFTFDHLVVALGAVVDLSRIPGMAEHALLIQNVGDAMKLRATIIARLEEANFVIEKDEQRKLLDFVVVGGGYSGVETAGQIISLLNSICQYYKNIEPGGFNVTLIHSGDVLLPTLSRDLGEYTHEKLTQEGVRVVLGHRVKAVTAKRVTLDNGTHISANTVISTVGNAPNPVVVDLCDRFSVPHEGYRIRTDAFCRVEGSDNLWAAGDCAAVPHPEGGNCPPTAQFAMRQGSHLGKNIARTLDGDWLQPFEFKGLGELAVIGHHKAVASVMGFKFSGFFAWWMWRTIYLSKLPGLDRKLRVMVEWTFDVFFPRDINLLTPRYSSSVAESHLEAGDFLFHPGEPAFSFYIVREGRIQIRDAEGNVVRTIGAGGHFGERALLADKVWRYHAVATEPTTLVALGDGVFQTIASSCGSIGRLLTQSAATYKSQDEIGDLVGRVPEANHGLDAQAMMSRSPGVLCESMTVGEALTVLQDSPHSLYPLVDREGKLVGGVLRSEFYEWIKLSDCRAATPLAEAPRSPAPVVAGGATLTDILNVLVRGSSSKAVVTDDDSRPIGIVSILDLVSDHTAARKITGVEREIPAGRSPDPVGQKLEIGSE